MRTSIELDVEGRFLEGYPLWWFRDFVDGLEYVVAKTRLAAERLPAAHYFEIRGTTEVYLEDAPGWTAPVVACLDDVAGGRVPPTNAS